MKEDPINKPSYAELEELLAEREKDNLKLHREIVKLMSNERSLKNRIKALEDQLEEEKREPKVKDLLDEIGDKGTLPSANSV
jgi:cell division protein FtsB